MRHLRLPRGNNPAANLSLRAEEIAAAIVDVPSAAKPDYKLIAPGDPVNSYLLMKIRGDGIAGDRMPPGEGPRAGGDRPGRSLGRGRSTGRVIESPDLGGQPSGLGTA